MTKMTDAFKKVFLGLGGNPKELTENNDVGDYILDLESAIKEYVGDKTEDLIDDTEASSTKTYSSTKIESLIPENELPTPESTNLGKVATVVSDGEGGYEWSAENAPAPESNVVIFDATTPAEGTIPGLLESTITSHTRLQIIDIVGSDFDENKPQTVTFLRFKFTNGNLGDKYIRLMQEGFSINNGTVYDVNYSGITWVMGKGLVRFDATVILARSGTQLTAQVEENVITTA